MAEFQKKGVPHMRYPYKSAFEEFQDQAQRNNFKHMDTNLSKIADTAERRVALAEQMAKSAMKDALFSKVISILSLLISLGSLVVSIVALAVR